MIPLGVDRASRNPPVVTHILLLTNLLVFAITWVAARSAPGAASAVDSGVFIPQWPAFAAHPWTIVSYSFLHDPASVWHVAFNMLFLWVFGRAVEGRLGPFWYLTFYLAACIVAALGHALVSNAGVIGASGAVAAVTGAFAALFPRARVRVLFLFTIMEVPGLLLVGLFVFIDVLGSFGLTRGMGGRVAYSAHLAGYAFGLGVMLTLLGFKLLPRTEFDLFFIAKQWRRRQEMRRVLAGASSPWRRDALRTAPATEAPTQPSEPSPAVAARELAAANESWTRGDFAKAASSWEQFASRHPSHPDSDGAQLLAAMAYTRKLADPQRAKRILNSLLTRLPAPSVVTRESARALVTEIEASRPADPT